MRNTPDSPDFRKEDDLRAVVAGLCERMKRVEQRLGLQPGVGEEVADAHMRQQPPDTAAPPQLAGETLEFELGQNWFAIIGIIVLAVGMAFVLSLPFASLPPYLPSLGGYLAVGLMLLVAKLGQAAFETVARYLRRAAMLLVFFATLRLCYFGAQPALEASSVAARTLFLAMVAINIWLAWRRSSPSLYIIALITGCGAALAVGTAWYVLLLLTALGLLTVHLQLRRNWRMLAPTGFVLSILTYAIWAAGNPVAGNPVAVQSQPAAAVYFILAWILVHTAAILWRADRSVEDTPVQVTVLLICGSGFGVFFLHNLLAHDGVFLSAHLAASAMFIGLALVFWKREQSWFSTFIYAMTGYAALSFALIKAFGIPEVFVALSLQSLVVIGTAVYFKSRFIVVTNCLIFVGIILGYVAVEHVERGMSLGFGIVALVTARILNWQQRRLELKTDLMRNIYLMVAFLVFPYALYFLVPEVYVAVAWVGLALFYYGMNLVIRNRKYRWMGHMTLLLTVLYVVVIGTSRLDTKYRIISFLVLGTIMVVVSLVFTTIRARHSRGENKKEAE